MQFIFQHAIHIPEEILGQKVVTIKDDCSIKSYGFCRYEKHKFQNTFHQPFKRYGNPDMQFLGTLKIFFQILNIFLVLLWNSAMIFIFKVAIWILPLVKSLEMATLNMKI